MPNLKIEDWQTDKIFERNCFISLLAIHITVKYKLYELVEKVKTLKEASKIYQQFF